MADDRGGSLLAWQWSRYPPTHRNRRNLLTHALTVPIFQAGTVAVVVAPFVSGWLALAGVGAMGGAMALQGRTHKLEQMPPSPFRGPFDVIARFLGEQWVTFPRYIASGEFARAWRESSAPGVRSSEG